MRALRLEPIMLCVKVSCSYSIDQSPGKVDSLGKYIYKQVVFV